MRLVPLLALVGCVNLDLDPDPWLIRDWALDEPRVVGVRAWPPVVEAGRGVALQALALTPDGLPEARVELCGLRTDREVLIDDVGCFRDEELVERIASAVPATWSSPDIRDAVCDVDDLQLGMSCVSVVPLLFSIGPAAAADTLGIAFDAPRLPTPLPRRLTLGADELAPQPGDRVRVTVDVEDDEGLAELLWWVDAGELLETGRTRAWVPEGEHAPGATRSENELQIPEGFRGPLRIAVVAKGEELVSSSWGVTTLFVDAEPTTCTATLDVLAWRDLDARPSAGGWDGDLWVVVSDLSGARLATARVPGVDLEHTPVPARLDVPCDGPGALVDVEVFLDTNLDADPSAPAHDDIDPFGRLLDQSVGPGVVVDVAIEVVPR